MTAHQVELGAIRVLVGAPFLIDRVEEIIKSPLADPDHSFETLEGWYDIGASKTGFEQWTTDGRIVNVKISLHEMSLGVVSLETQRPSGRVALLWLKGTDELVHGMLYSGVRRIQHKGGSWGSGDGSAMIIEFCAPTVIELEPMRTVK